MSFKEGNVFNLKIKELCTGIKEVFFKKFKIQEELGRSNLASNNVLQLSVDL